MRATEVVYCSDCDAVMVACEWEGWDCPVCDEGHCDGPDWQPPFSNVRELIGRDGRAVNPYGI